MSGAELPEITTGASSGTVRSNAGSRARKVNFAGMPARYRSTTARGKRTFSPPASTRQPCRAKISRACAFRTRSPTCSRISSEASWTRRTSPSVRNAAGVRIMPALPGAAGVPRAGHPAYQSPRRPPRDARPGRRRGRRAPRRVTPGARPRLCYTGTRSYGREPPMPAGLAQSAAALSPAEQKAFYEEQGYIVLPGAARRRTRSPCSARALAEVLEEARGADREQREVLGHARRRRPAPRPPDLQPDRAPQGVLRPAFHPRILDAVEKLIGPNIQLHHTKLNLKPPSSPEARFEWHQDYPFFPHTNYDLIAVLVHIDEATEENGCLRIIPGSHKLGAAHARVRQGRRLLLAARGPERGRATSRWVTRARARPAAWRSTTATCCTARPRTAATSPAAP